MIKIYQKLQKEPLIQ